MQNNSLTRKTTKSIKTETTKTTKIQIVHYQNNRAQRITVNMFKTDNSEPVSLNAMFIGIGVWGGLIFMMICIFSVLCFGLSRQVNADQDGQDDENQAYLLVSIDTIINERYLYDIDPV